MKKGFVLSVIMLFGVLINGQTETKKKIKESNKKIKATESKVKDTTAAKDTLKDFKKKYKKWEILY